MKKVNLDGPAGLQLYWHDPREKLEMFSKRARRGRLKMVSGAISSNWKADLVGIEDNMDSGYSIKALQQWFTAVAGDLYGES